MKNFVKYSLEIFDRIRGRVISFALFKIFGKVLTGPWGWIATTIGEKLFTKLLKPLWNRASAWIYSRVKKITFKKKGKKLKEAKNENDFDDAFDDLP